MAGRTYTLSIHGQPFDVTGLDVVDGKFWAVVDGARMHGAVVPGNIDRDGYWSISWDGMMCRAWETDIYNAIAEAVEYLSGW